MSSEIGHHLRLSIFGESHGAGIGVVINGLPAGMSIDLDRLQAFMDRRAPGTSKLTTKRRESDQPEILSGFYQGHTTGSPLAAIIRNNDMRSKDYADLAALPRPAHADYTAAIKYKGFSDMRGGGHFSGRLTAPLCIAGGIALQILEKHQISIGAHLLQIGTTNDRPFNPLASDDAELLFLQKQSFPVLDPKAAQTMQDQINACAVEGDSIGGIIEGIAIGCPVGLGNPMFDGVENRLASALFGIPGVKGVSFGSGFDAAHMTGSVHNDPFDIDAQGRIHTLTNHAGGILGGITTGMPITCQVAMKPTPSISQPQQTVSLTERKPTALTVNGRHDPCIAIRAVPVVEAVFAIVLLDLILEEEPNHEIR